MFGNQLCIYGLSTVDLSTVIVTSRLLASLEPGKKRPAGSLDRGPLLKSVMNDFTMFLYCMYDLHDPVTSYVTVCVSFSLYSLLHRNAAVRNS